MMGFDGQEECHAVSMSSQHTCTHADYSPLIDVECSTLKVESYSLGGSADYIPYQCIGCLCLQK